MPLEIPLITTIATALGLALVMGFLAARLRLPTIVGYLFAGILIGPFTPGFVANGEIARELAEIGVMLLMFGVGLHFSFQDLLAVRKIALPGALVQIAVASLLGTIIGLMWGWGWGGSLIFGVALSVASTVVLVRTLESRHDLDSSNGRIAVGWLVVEDLAMVIVLLLLPAFASFLGSSPLDPPAHTLFVTLILSICRITAFLLFMLLIGRRIFPFLLWHVARTGSHELFTLCIAAAAVSVAFAAAKLFGMSFALGAFFAGMMLQESKFSERAAEESLPLREAFTVLFFVAMGMLFDPTILLTCPLQVLAIVSIIIIGKSVAASVLVLALHYPLSTALTVSASLAQIGEFSFILAEMGARLGLLPAEGQSLIIAGALISITLNPLVFKVITPAQRWLESHPKIAERFSIPQEEKTTPLD